MTIRYLHDAVREGDDMRARCLNWRCYASRRLDLAALETKLGRYFSADPVDISYRLCCPKCGGKHVKVVRIDKEKAPPPIRSVGYIVPPG